MEVLVAVALILGIIEQNPFLLIVFVIILFSLLYLLFLLIREFFCLYTFLESIDKEEVDRQIKDVGYINTYKLYKSNRRLKAVKDKLETKKKISENAAEAEKLKKGGVSNDL
ncbi:MAG TPA: hypothetical protein PLZ43_15400 [bacterium]|nr:hypothetical protein [bacterium]